MTPNWVEQLSALTATPEAAARFHTQRTQAATAVAQTIFKTLGINRKQKIPALYAVWLCGHTQPTYIGQTMDMGRRLWDLPIGESHHLANSFPVEIWKAVMVLRWHDLLRHHKPKELDNLMDTLDVEPSPTKTAEAKKLEHIGMAFEHLLQKTYKPLFNMRKRKPDGTWRPVNLERSQSTGARTAKLVGDLWPFMLHIWKRIAETEHSKNQSQIEPFGGVVHWNQKHLFDSKSPQIKQP